MQPFVLAAATTVTQAIEASAGRSAGPMEAQAQFLAGGTTLIDLMKLNVMRPAQVVDINPLGMSELGRIDASEEGLRLGALVRMADAADHPLINRSFPAIAQSLRLAASPQIRNMATLGGNVLQHTRCPYFRDVSYAECNKRNPGSGCAALDGFNRSHAVLGTSNRCIATYPGDFAQALIAFDAVVEIAGLRGRRRIPFAQLHCEPGDTPEVEATLEPGDIITAFVVPASPWNRRSLFLRVRDRESYEFALASAVVALDLADGQVRDARIALGGVATVPWRGKAAEAALKDKALDEPTKQAAADAAFSGATTHGHNAFKV